MGAPRFKHRHRDTTKGHATAAPAGFSSAAAPIQPSMVEKSKFKRFGFAGLTLLFSAAIFALQEAFSVLPVEHSWMTGACFLLAVTILMLIGVWFWDRSAEQHVLIRSAASLVGVLLIAGFGYSPVMKQYGIEHSSPEMPHLSVAALATNITYKAGTQVAGTVNWQKEYAEVRLFIKPNSEFPISNVDLTIQTMENTQILGGVGQTSSILGVQFRHHFEGHFPDIVLYDKDGQPSHVKPLFDDSMAKASPFSTEYGIYCPRLSPDEDLRLIVAVFDLKNPGVAPRQLRIHGVYDTGPTGKAERIPINEVIDVKR